jgi:hypothetical protein
MTKTLRGYFVKVSLLFLALFATKNEDDKF